MVDTTKIVNELAGVAGREFVKSHKEALSEYAVDGIVPKAVVFPKDTRQVSEVVKYAAAHNLGIVPRGNGSKMALGNPPKRLDVVVCTTRMNHMKDVDVANLTLTVEAGVKFLDIQARLATEDDRCYLPLEDLAADGREMICSDRSHSGCFLPIDAPFSSTATIGGIIAVNSSGPRRLLYNLPRDIILGTRFVAADGEIIGSGGKTVKNVSGYDISKLMVGSAGSLGIICETTLRLLPLPEAMETLLFSFNDFSDAADFADRIFDTGLLPAAVEVMNGKAFGNLKVETLSDFKAGLYIAAVALEAYAEAVDRMHTEMRKMAAKAGAKGEAILQEDIHRLFWLEVGDLAPSAEKQSAGLLSAQLNYPISEWKDIVAFTTGTLEGNNLDYTLLTHTGSGLCLINLLTNGDNSKEKPLDALKRLLERCRESGGNLIIQKAPANLKQKLSVWGEPGSDLVVMKRIKEKLDPQGIMSPGRYMGGL